MNVVKKYLSIHMILSFSTVTLFITLLFFPKASLNGAENGILLWFNVILPTLLPFIIASNLIINLRLSDVLSKLFYPFLKRILHVSREGSYVSVIGLLTGLPVGAKACADLVKENRISKEEGQYLLTYCNNASPMFILSYVSITTLGLAGKRYVFLLLIYFSAILTGFLYRFVHKDKIMSFSISTKPVVATDTMNSNAKFELMDTAIMSGFDVITRVGGYIVLFSIISNVFLSLAPANSLLSYVTVGVIEITNGVNTLGSLAISMKLKIALLLSLTAFGGLSSVAQTKSVIDGSGLSIKNYLFYKIINACITFVIVSCYLQLCKF